PPLVPKRRSRGEGTLVQRGPHTWRLRAYAGRDPVTGRPRQVSRTVEAPNKTEAIKLLRKFVEEVDEGQVAKVGTSATVGALLDHFIAHLERVGRERTTIETYERADQLHLRPALGNVKLRDLDSFALDGYYRQKSEAGLSPNYIRVHHALMSGALTQA